MPPYLTLEPAPEEIRTERLLLRPFRKGDGSALLEALLESRSELDRYFFFRHAIATVDDAEDLCRQKQAEWISRNVLAYAIFDEWGKGRYLGSVDLVKINWERRKFEIAYYLRTSATGNGYMSEAVRALTSMALNDLAANRVELWCDVENVPSMRVADRCGFTFEGRLRNRGISPDGTPRDMFVYSIVPGDLTI
jgi:ribosomal-protein-serine acetyltransferase